MTDRTYAVPLTLVVLSAMALAIFSVAFDRDWFPLGLPGEWLWATPDVWSEATSEWLLFLPAGLSVALLVGWTFYAAGWVEDCPRWVFIFAIGGCIALGAAFQSFCEIAAPRGLQKWAVLHSHNPNSIHAAAVRHADDLPALLENHANIIRDRRPHHFTVNPPGWVTLYSGLIRFYRQHPQVAKTVWSLAPSELPWKLRRLNGWVSIPYDEQAAVATVAAFSRLICFAGAIPAAWLALARCGRKAALAIASSVLLLPVEPLFAPRSDTVYPAIALLVLAISHHAWERRSWVLAALAGVVLGVGTFFSMCFFIVGGLAALYVAGQSLGGKRPTLAAVFAAPLCWLGVVVLIFILGHNLFPTWSVNIAKNAEFNGLFRQSYAKWTLVNLLEFGAALGLPLIIFLAGRIVVLRRFDPLLCSWAAILAFLDLNGTNRGEACRLWLFMMPIAAMLAVEWLPTLGRWFRPTLAAFLLLQALNCVVLDRDLVLVTDPEESAMTREIPSPVPKAKKHSKSPETSAEGVLPRSDAD
jgi:methylthioxylose transferase